MQRRNITGLEMKASQSGAQTSRYNRLVTVFVALGSFVSLAKQYI